MIAEALAEIGRAAERLSADQENRVDQATNTETLAAHLDALSGDRARPGREELPAPAG